MERKRHGTILNFMYVYILGLFNTLLGPALFIVKKTILC